MIRYGMVRPTGQRPDTKLEKKTFRSLPGNLAKHWLVGVFDGREKIADLFVVDEVTLLSGPKSELWKLAALIWKEDWKSSNNVMWKVVACGSSSSSAAPRKFPFPSC
jgi:hypothetical protein